MKKAIIIPILIIFILFPVKLFARMSYPIHEEDSPAGDLISKSYVVGKSDEYIFARKANLDNDFEFKQSGLYTNDDKRTLIYALPNFYDEVLYISDDGFTVLVEADSYIDNNLNIPIFTLYKNGNKVKEYELSSIYNFSFELPLTSNGYEWENDMYNIYNNYNNSIRYLGTYNGIKVTVNTLTGEMTKTLSYFEKLEIVFIIYYVVCAFIVLAIFTIKGKIKRRNSC